MPTPKKGARLGAGPAHQKLLVANLASNLFEHGRITTTEAKARVLRPVAEKLITKAKKGDLHHRRQVLSTIRDKGVVHTLFEEIGPRYAERPGGYTRITKIGPRKGDNAPMAVIELVTEDYAPQQRSSTRSAGSTAAGSPGQQTGQQTGQGTGPAASTSPEPGEAEDPVEVSEEPAEAEDTSGVEAAPASADPATQAAEEDAPAQESTDEAVEGEDDQTS